MSVLRHFLCLIFLASAPIGGAQAAEITSQDMAGGKTAIFIIGEIVSSDVASFRNLAQKYSTAVVLLESNGGSAAAAIEIGKDIRLKGFATGVINSSECDSACALIWLAGSPRRLAKSAKVGFHATYVTFGGRTSESGVGNAIVGRYLTLLNLPEDAIVFATSAQPNQLNYLTSANYKYVGMDVDLVDDIPDQQPPPVVAMSAVKKDVTKWSSAGDWGVFVDHSTSDGCFLIGNYLSGTNFRIGINPPANNNYVILENAIWKSLKVGSQYPIVLKFDNNSPWNVSAKATKMDNDTVLLFTFSDTQFWKEFGSSASLQISRNSVLVSQLKLTNSTEALAKLNECQRSHSLKAPTDPFAD